MKRYFAIVEHIDKHLQACLFLLMCIGLVLASSFLLLGKIDGQMWVTVCGILFGTNAIGGGLAQFGNGSRAPNKFDLNQFPRGEYEHD